MSLDDRKALARSVLASLSDVPPDAVRLLASALGYADGPLARFAFSLDSYADELADPTQRGTAIHPGQLDVRESDATPKRDSA